MACLAKIELNLPLLIAGDIGSPRKRIDEPRPIHLDCTSEPSAQCRMLGQKG